MKAITLSLICSAFALSACGGNSSNHGATLANSIPPNKFQQATSNKQQATNNKQQTTNNKPTTAIKIISML